MTKTKVKNKKNIYNLGKSIYDATVDSIDEIIKKYYHQDTVWHGPHPFKTLKGRKELINNFWKPFLNSFPDAQKNDYILFGGKCRGADREEWREWEETVNDTDKERISYYFGDDTESGWVHSSGTYVATFERDFLGIPATKRAVWIRYGEFYRMVDGKIAETIVVMDLLDLMRQAGFRIYPSGSQEITMPAPSTQDGIQLGEFDSEESQKTLKIVEDMIFKGIHSYEDEGLEGMGMENYFHEDFMYYAPHSWGQTRGVDNFTKYIQGPFQESFPDLRGGMHEARFAEGKYCCSTGPIKGTHAATNYLGLPALEEPVLTRAMDVWRREGDKLVENWLHLDIIDFLLQYGIDIFERLNKGNFCTREYQFVSQLSEDEIRDNR
ncbi:ester cyclase [Candidatus Bipolaricaulota bacterium]|nr:ester cyclase [Candidatus Bipolaricaulota bacterium]